VVTSLLTPESLVAVLLPFSALCEEIHFPLCIVLVVVFCYVLCLFGVERPPVISRPGRTTKQGEKSLSFAPDGKFSVSNPIKRIHWFVPFSAPRVSLSTPRFLPSEDPPRKWSPPAEIFFLRDPSSSPFSYALQDVFSTSARLRMLSPFVHQTFTRKTGINSDVSSPPSLRPSPPSLSHFLAPLPTSDLRGSWYFSA